eukprot:11329677-Prorocentrum_lima.AAC.1
MAVLELRPANVAGLPKTAMCAAMSTSLGAGALPPVLSVSHRRLLPRRSTLQARWAWEFGWVWRLQIRLMMMKGPATI